MRRRDADRCKTGGAADPQGSKTTEARSFRPRAARDARPAGRRAVARGQPAPGLPAQLRSRGQYLRRSRTLTRRAGPARLPAALGAISAPPSAPRPRTGRSAAAWESRQGACALWALPTTGKLPAGRSGSLRDGIRLGPRGRNRRGRPALGEAKMPLKSKDKGKGKSKDKDKKK